MSRITSQIAMPAALLGLTLALAGPLAAQTTEPAPQAPAQTASENGVAPPSQPSPAQPVASSEGECPPTAAKAEPATPEGASSDGTAPENSGSTGWTGGTGGSQIGTNPSGASLATKTWHAPTARGLDLKGRPDPAPAC